MVILMQRKGAKETESRQTDDAGHQNKEGEYF